MSDSQSYLHPAMAALHAAVTKAATTGQEDSQAVFISYGDLARSIGKRAPTSQEDSQLLVEITTTWLDPDQEDESLDG